MLTKESSTRIRENQITTAQDAFSFCCDSISGIKFFFLPADELEDTRRSLQERYKVGHTIPGTRSFHVFIPVQAGVIAFKRTTEDAEMSGEHHFFKAASRLRMRKLQDYLLQYMMGTGVLAL